MAKVEGLNQLYSRWYVRIVIPDDLREVYGKDRLNPALETSDRREATLLATRMRTEWFADFDTKHRQAKPIPLAAVTSAMSREWPRGSMRQHCALMNSFAPNSAPVRANSAA